MKPINKGTRTQEKERSRTKKEAAFIVAFTLAAITFLNHASEFIPDMMRGHNPTLVQAKERLSGETEKKEEMKSIKSLEEVGRVTMTATTKIKQKEDLLQTKPRVRSDFQWAKKKEEAEQLRMKRQVVCDPSDISQISNLTVDQMVEVFKGTWLEGKEEDLYRLEHEYQVNVFFIYGVSSLESGYGTSPKARNKANYYGIYLDTDYETWEENTEYFCELISRAYVGKGCKSVSRIAPIYCPPTPEDWTHHVTSLMNGLYNGDPVELQVA